MSKRTPKIVVIGAGSATFGLGILSTMMQYANLNGAHLCLCDLSIESLETVHKLAEKMNVAWGAEFKISASTNRRDLLPDADFVIVTVQVGQRETVWESDWQVPLKHGIRQPYAQNGGPGSFANMARNLPLVMAIARDMEELCPNAYYLNLVNPIIRLNTALHRYTTLKVVGLSHQLFWAYAMTAAVLPNRWGIQIPALFNVHADVENMKTFVPIAQEAAKHIEIKAAGINHFSWVYDIRDRETGEDLYPLLREGWLSNGFRRDFEPLSRELFEIYDMMPVAGDTFTSEYLQWVVDPNTKPWEKYNLKLQSWEGNRARRSSQEQLAKEVATGTKSVDELKNVTQYQLLDNSIPQMIDAVFNNKNHYYAQVNIPNKCYIPNLPDDAIVEVPANISAFGFQGLSFPPLPDGIATMCRRELELSSMYADAAYEGDKKLALQAMLLDPMVTDIDTARAVLDDLLETNKDYLPHFFKKGETV